VFSQQRIKATLNNDFVTVRLFAGKMPAGQKQIPNGEDAEAFRDEKLKNNALPYYVILKPITDGKLKKIASYEKPTIDPVSDEFPTFLAQSLAASAEIKPK
jgi:hypothetical protein